ncbi:MAG: PhzF family phenazine biosynthesis isomerase [Candidatus Lokiarchaeota archaeon]|nr:PhzF family phenazine biosynthesis isomerase [Candidatus Lokiarchaeota archaeon]
MVDAFTDKIFTGNPAAILLNPVILPDTTMQRIAREFNLSETAFPTPIEGSSFEQPYRFNLRWFTPTVEVPLCGHATLATAHVILSELGNSNSKLVFSTHSGDLVISRDGDFYVMDFPSGVAQPVDIYEDVLKALKLGQNDVEEMLYCEEPNKLLVVLRDVDVVRNVTPDFPCLLEVSKNLNAGSVIVTALSPSSKYDFISRNFAPLHGVNEDPVTGSSHVILGPYWQKRLDKYQLRAYQASTRGGSMELEIRSSGRILLKGTARTVAKGTMNVE